MTKEEVIKILKEQNTPESRFTLYALKKREGKVWDSTVGKFGAWVEKKEAK